MTHYSNSDMNYVYKLDLVERRHTTGKYGTFDLLYSTATKFIRFPVASDLVEYIGGVEGIGELYRALSNPDALKVFLNYFQFR